MCVIYERDRCIGGETVNQVAGWYHSKWLRQDVGGMLTRTSGREKF